MNIHRRTYVQHLFLQIILEQRKLREAEGWCQSEVDSEVYWDATRSETVYSGGGLMLRGSWKETNFQWREESKVTVRDFLSQPFVCESRETNLTDLLTITAPRHDKE